MWTGPEEKSFNAVLAASRRRTRRQGVLQVDRRQHADGARDRGGRRQPARPRIGLAAGPRQSDFQKKGALKTIDYAKGALSRNYPADIAKLGVIKGHVYGFLIKGANKSTVWYNVKAFKNAGVKAPTTWPALVKARRNVEGLGHSGLLRRRC